VRSRKKPVMKYGVRTGMVGATLALAMACNSPTNPPESTGQVPAPAAGDDATTRTIGGRVGDMVTIKRVQVQADGSWKVLAQARITRAQQRAMNERRAARARGESPALHQASVAMSCDDDLWVNDDVNQEGNRICVAPGSEAELIGCPFDENRSVFQTRSYWGGPTGFRLWGKFWADVCIHIGTYTLRNGAAWERNDNFGPPYPSYATVF
jgi:hypothetical protein